jgi:serine/threonine protein phosphatase PrpC
VSAKAPVPEVKVSVYGISDVGVVRTNNEDTFLVAEMTTGASGLVAGVIAHQVQERGTLLVVSDGMGGAEAGEVASRIVVDHTRAELAAAPLDHSAEDVLRAAIEKVNLAIWSDAQANAQHKGMGATLAGAWIRGSDAFIAGVGDSRVYLLRSGKMRQITRDQSMVESLVEVGMIDRKEAEQHPQRNVILQAMGARPEVVVAIERLELRRGDFLLLCSDGLSGKMTADEMRDCILTTAALPEACHRMVHIAKARGGEDNITVIVAELDGEGLLESTLNERMTRTLQSLSGFNFRAGGGYAPPPPTKPTHTFGSENTDDDAPPEQQQPTAPAPPHDPTQTLTSAPPPRPHSPTSVMGSGTYPIAPVDPKKKD